MGDPDISPMTSNASEGNIPDSDDSTQPLPLADRAKHDSLWFEDGNIILATSNTLFKVYRGILSQNSPIFEHMFSHPPPLSSDLDVMDCVVVVHMPDREKDLEHFLRALYIRSSYTPLACCSWEAAAALLRLSIKYEVHDLRREITHRFNTEYPACSDEFARARDHAYNEGSMIIDPDHAGMVSLARETHLHYFLPVAYYALLGEMDGAIIHSEDDSTFDFLARLSVADIVICIRARENIRRDFARFVTQSFIYISVPWQGCKESDCEIRTLRFMASNQWQRALSRPWSLGLRWGEPGTGDCPDDMCLDCVWRLNRRIRDARQEIWNQLPLYFDLPKWDELWDEY